MGTLRVFEVGEQYGRLTVIERRDTNIKTVLCRCDCGIEKHIAIRRLVDGQTRSCGCLQRELAKDNSTTHGMSGTPVFECWRGMIKRCTNPNASNYHNYGGRGITVDPRWLVFENFYEDMGDPPPNTTLDRENNNQGYSKENCRWATWSQQMSNRRPFTRTVTETEQSSVHKGVSWYSRDNKWRAAPHINGIKVPLGYYDTEAEAVQAIRNFRES